MQRTCCATGVRTIVLQLQELQHSCLNAATRIAVIMWHVLGLWLVGAHAFKHEPQKDVIVQVAVSWQPAEFSRQAAQAAADGTDRSVLERIAHIRNLAIG